MNRVAATPHRRTRIFRVLVVGAALGAAGAGLTARAARAQFPLPPLPSPHQIHHDVLEVVHDVLSVLGSIPEQLDRDDQRGLEVFYSGSQYYAPHRHEHYIYNIPVWIDGEVYYRPYTYCNDHLYGSYSYRPRVWTGWGQESQGHYCNYHHGYYPNGHACFRQNGYRQNGYPRPFESYGGHYETQHYREGGYGSNYGYRSYPSNHHYEAHREWVEPRGHGYRPPQANLYRGERREHEQPGYRHPDARRYQGSAHGESRQSHGHGNDRPRSNNGQQGRHHHN